MNAGAQHLYIGIMSGTSADGIDAALVDLSDSQPQLVASEFTPFDASIRQAMLDLFTPGDNEIDRLGELDVLLGSAYLQATESLLDKASTPPQQVRAVGLHGQTIRHRPDFKHPFTLQIGNPYGISHKLGICVVNDFRRADMYLGGQGAPLGPLFHQALFGSDLRNRVIINTGGIANISYLKADGSVIGFDTGPANGLMDAWIEKVKGDRFDHSGSWAATGQVLDEVLENWLQNPYFRQRPPKSTGKEYFTLDALQIPEDKDPADIQRTLCELSAQTIANAISQFCSDADEVWICGGGAFNPLLMDRIAILSGLPTASTSKLGIAPDWVEAVGFAWLAKTCLEGKAIATGPVTGATTSCILGAIHPAKPQTSRFKNRDSLD